MLNCLLHILMYFFECCFLNNCKRLMDVVKNHLAVYTLSCSFDAYLTKQTNNSDYHILQSSKSRHIWKILPLPLSNLITYKPLFNFIPANKDYMWVRFLNCQAFRLSTVLLSHGYQMSNSWIACLGICSLPRTRCPYPVLFTST